MLSIKDVISGRRDYGNLTIPEQPGRLVRAKQEIKYLLGNVTPTEPSTYDLEETYKILITVTRMLPTMKTLPVRYIKRAPWVMFQSPVDDGVILAENKRFLVAYLSELRERASSPAILTFANVYLKYYPVESRHADLIQVALVNLLKTLKTPRGMGFRERSAKFHLLRKDGPGHIARLMFEAESPYSVAKEAGLVGPLEQQGLIVAASQSLLERISGLLKKGKMEEPWLEVILDFFKPIDGQASEVRFPGLRIALADALLQPFIDKNPDPAIQDIISKHLLSYFNDPRLNTASWHGVDSSSVNVMMRWLVSGTLKDFFRVVSEGSGGHSDADRMWPYRRAFWSAYLDGGYITDAWVVLGEEIAYKARNFLKDQADTYGRLKRGGGVLPRHAVLIMRIGDLVITEWNYSGKYRAWSTDNEDAPKFYKKHYQRDQLVNFPDFDGAHHGAPHGTWQNKLSDLINEWTGIKVNARQYMPK
jgi:hypothetical protein